MALLTKDEAYNWLKVFLKDGFEVNDKTQTVRISKELSEKEFDGILCDMLNLIGNKELPHPKDHNEVKALYQNFKLDPNRIPIDSETLTINKYGLLQANIEKITNNDDIIEGLAKNETFMAKIKEYMKPELGNSYNVGMHLLASPVFMRMLTSLVSLIQESDKKNDGKYVETIIKNYFEELDKYGDPNKTEATKEESSSKSEDSSSTES